MQSLWGRQSGPFQGRGGSSLRCHRRSYVAGQEMMERPGTLATTPDVKTSCMTPWIGSNEGPIERKCEEVDKR